MVSEWPCYDLERWQGQLRESAETAVHRCLIPVRVIWLCTWARWCSLHHLAGVTCVHLTLSLFSHDFEISSPIFESQPNSSDDKLVCIGVSHMVPLTIKCTLGSSNGAYTVYNKRELLKLAGKNELYYYFFRQTFLVYFSVPYWLSC